MAMRIFVLFLEVTTFQSEQYKPADRTRCNNKSTPQLEYRDYLCYTVGVDLFSKRQLYFKKGNCNERKEY